MSILMDERALTSYYQDRATELREQLSFAKSFFAKHKPSYGFYGEHILRKFIEETIPQDFGVCQGFVSLKEELSHQCDIIVYTRCNCNPMYSFGDIQIIPAKAVKSVVEVKCSISKKGIGKTINDFKLLAKMGVLNKHLFIFNAPSSRTLCHQIGFFGRYDHGDEYILPSSIFALNRDFCLEQGEVVEYGRDSFGYKCYKIEHLTNQQFYRNISSLQLFLASIFADCGLSVNDNNPLLAAYNCMVRLRLVDAIALFDM